MIHIATEFWVIGDVVPVLDSDDAYCGEGDCPKRGLKYLTIIGIKDTETGKVREIRRVGCCCAERAYGEPEPGRGNPLVREGMKKRYVVYWDVRDEHGKRVAAYGYSQESTAREHATKIRGTSDKRKGWELCPSNDSGSRDGR